MAPRANWKGYLRIAELSCPVALYTAASTAERIAFHTINRATGNRVHREFVDSATGRPVDKDDQVKGYEVDRDEYVLLEPDEVAAAIPDSDKTLAISAFIACEEIDDVYLDRPYYLAPAGPVATEIFVLIREGMRKSGVAAIAQAVLFRRVRTLLIRPEGDGLIATTLNFDYEVRPADEAFEDVPDTRIEGEMLDLARHIITTKTGTFIPSDYDDRYEAALADLVKAKLEGRKIEPRRPQRREKVVDLMAALRESAGLGRPPRKQAKPAPAPSPRLRPKRDAKAKAPAPRRKAS